MNKRVQKIIAREFLLLIGIIPIVGLGYLAVVFWNGYHGSKAVEYRIEAKALNNEVEPIEYRDVCRTMASYYDSLVDKYDLISIDTFFHKLRVVAKRKIIYNTLLKEQAIDSNIPFELFSSNIALEYGEYDLLFERQQRMLKEKNRLMTLHRGYHYSKLDDFEILDLLMYIGLGFLILIYPVRGFLLGVRWSFKTLRENGDVEE